MKHLTIIALAILTSGRLLAAGGSQPWLDANRSADERARLAVAAMSLEEKLSMLH